MKRKIAILLSAMMVTSAMPFSVNAAQLKSDSVQNQGYAKANQSIDPNAGEYQNITTVNELKGRRSVLKINLNDESTDLIPANTSFYVDLENGKFVNEGEVNKDANTTSYGYVNVAGNRSFKYDDVKNFTTNLTQAWEGMTIGSTSTVEALNTPINLTSISIPGDTTGAATTAAGELYTKLQAATEQKLGDIRDLEILVGAEMDTILRTVGVSSSAPELPHIPYKAEFVSPTRLKVTTIMPLENGDKSRSIGGASYAPGDLEIRFYTDTTCNEPLKLNGTETASQIQGMRIISKGVENNITIKDPYIALPLGGVIADGDGPVKATVTAEYNDKVIGAEYTITKGLENNGTSLVYDTRNIKLFDDRTELEQVTIRENVRDSIGENNNKSKTRFTVRLNGGFRFKNQDEIVANLAKDDKSQSIGAIFAFEGNSAGSPNFKEIKMLNDRTIQVEVTGMDTGRPNPIGIAMRYLEIEPEDERKYGDVEITVSGDGINNQTVKVAERAQLGFKLETLKDPTEIISGRHYQADKRINMSEADNNTVDIKFSEAIPNTLVTSRNLDFNLPEGVKFVRAEIDSNTVKNFTGLADEDFEIINNGRTLRLNRNTYALRDRINSMASFVMKLNLSIDPAFTGDVKLSVVGGGQSEGTTPEVVIAKAKAPFEIKTQSTKVDLGYQDYNTADIVITETKPGMFLEGQIAEIGLTAPYGTGEVGFSEASFEVTGGELSIREKDFGISKNNKDNKDGVISFKIDRASYKNPSTVTIKNVKIGSTRSVPFGSYDLSIGGKAVINNFSAEDEKVENVMTHANGVIYDQKVKLNDANAASSNYGLEGTSYINALRYQDNTSSYKVKDYVNVVTATGTFNETVKVSVGEKTILLGDKAIDMDVAPYIQASSNSTMVPLRFVSVALGVDSENAVNPDASNKIAWDANTKTTTIYYGAGTGQKIIQFQAGSNIMTVDGTRIPMEFGVKAEIKDGRMFVPFRALGQALGVTVTWDADTRTAIYNENNARNVNNTTTATTTESTTETTTASTSTTESTTATTDSTTETTTAKN